MDTRTNSSQQAAGLTGLLHRIAGGRLLAALAFAFVLIGGIVTFRTMPVDAFPDVTPTLVQVFTETEAICHVSRRNLYERAAPASRGAVDVKLWFVRRQHLLRRWRRYLLGEATRR